MLEALRFDGQLVSPGTETIENEATVGAAGRLLVGAELRRAELRCSLADPAPARIDNRDGKRGRIRLRPRQQRQTDHEKEVLHT